MALFKDKTIHTRVMEVVKTRIADGQTKFEAEVDTLHEAYNATMDDLTTKLEADKGALVERIVADIFAPKQ